MQILYVINQKKNISVIFLFLTFIIFLYLTPVFAGVQINIQGKVMQVKDGDTVVISPIEGGQFFICRLYGIDAPEVAKKGKEGMPYGEEAMRALKQMILGQIVEVKLTGQKTYNREVCIIEKDNKNINLEMVRQGWAWAYVEYLKRPHASEFLDVEMEARSKKLGLWKQTNPLPPWEFRKLHK